MTLTGYFFCSYVPSLQTCFIHWGSELKHEKRKMSERPLFYFIESPSAMSPLIHLIEWHDLTHIYCCTYYILSPSELVSLSDRICKHIAINILQIFVSAQIHRRKLIPLGHYSSWETPRPSEAGIHCHLSGVSASAPTLWLIASGLAGEQISS